MFTHEIGHCLGLRHTDSTQYIMYPQNGAAGTPHPDELAAITDAYVPVSAPSAQNTTNFFQTTGSTALRQHVFPQFALSATMGESSDAANFSTTLAPAQPGPRIDRPFFAVVHRLQRDGSCLESVQAHDGPVTTAVTVDRIGTWKSVHVQPSPPSAPVNP